MITGLIAVNLLACRSNEDSAAWIGQLPESAPSAFTAIVKNPTRFNQRPAHDGHIKTTAVNGDSIHLVILPESTAHFFYQDRRPPKGKQARILAEISNPEAPSAGHSFQYPTVAPGETAFLVAVYQPASGGMSGSYQAVAYRVDSASGTPLLTVEPLSLVFCDDHTASPVSDAQVDHPPHNRCPAESDTAGPVKHYVGHGSWVACGSGCCTARALGKARGGGKH